MDELAFSIQQMILERKQKGRRLCVALDGRCASGKTTLAERLKKVLPCSVIHMDDFFLRPEQRTKERLTEPGGNVDYERLEKEVLIPLTQGKPFSYRPFDCHTQEFKAPIDMEQAEIYIVEGAYACHTKLWHYYAVHIFLTTDKNMQEQRILKRNGRQGLILFKEKWIPLEEQYIEAFKIEERCELKYKN